MGERTMELNDPRDLAMRVVALLAFLPALAFFAYFAPIWLGFTLTLGWTGTLFYTIKQLIEEAHDAL